MYKTEHKKIKRMNVALFYILISFKTTLTNAIESFLAHDLSSSKYVILYHWQFFQIIRFRLIAHSGIGKVGNG